MADKEIFAIYQAMYDDHEQCLVNGQYTASIASSAMLVEALLLWVLKQRGIKPKSDRFFDLIETAEYSRVISSELAKRLHKLRKIRNSYVHFDLPKIESRGLERYKDSHELEKRGLEENIGAIAPKPDAKDAFVIVAEFMGGVFPFISSLEHRLPTEDTRSQLPQEKEDAERAFKKEKKSLLDKIKELFGVS